MEQVKSKDILDMAVDFIVLTRNIKMRIKYLESGEAANRSVEDLLEEELIFLKRLIGEEMAGVGA